MRCRDRRSSERRLSCPFRSGPDRIARFGIRVRQRERGHDDSQNHVVPHRRCAENSTNGEITSQIPSSRWIQLDPGWSPPQRTMARMPTRAPTTTLFHMAFGACIPQHKWRDDDPEAQQDVYQTATASAPFRLHEFLVRSCLPSFPILKNFLCLYFRFRGCVPSYSDRIFPR